MVETDDGYDIGEGEWIEEEKGFSGYFIATVWGGHDAVLGNANLITAAPDLMKALDEAYRFIGSEYGCAESQALEGEFVSREARQVWAKICAAIAKAKGGAA